MAYRVPQYVPEERMNSKNYTKFDKTFMAFGSIMNSLQHTLNESNKQELIDWAWNEAVNKVSELVDYYSKEEVAKKSDKPPF